MLKRRALSSLLALALTLAACGRDDSTATTALTTTSTSPATSTSTTLPTPTVLLDLGEAPPELADAVGDVYLAAMGGETAGELPEGLRALLAGRPRSGDTLAVAGGAQLGTVEETPVAVVTADDDVVLAVGDAAGGWSVAGAKLARFGLPAWYGPAPRLVMVIGSDARPGQNPLRFRADSLHIVSVVAETGEGALVGIPRDTWVETPYGRKDKLTHTMASRGPEVVVDTLVELSGLPLEGYLLTGFKDFVALVNAFGDFDMDVPFAMAEPKSGAYFRAGPQAFDGADALAFARNRTLPGGDFTRQLHGGLLLRFALVAIQARGVEAVPTLLETFTRFVHTDLTPAELLTLAAALYELDTATVDNIVLPGSAGWAGAASVVFLDDAAFHIFADLEDGTLDGSE